MSATIRDYSGDFESISFRPTLVGDSKDTPNREVVFDLPTMRVRDLCQRAARREMETGREQVLAIDMDTQTYKHSCTNCIMESIKGKLSPTLGITIDHRRRESNSLGYKRPDKPNFPS